MSRSKKRGPTLVATGHGVPLCAYDRLRLVARCAEEYGPSFPYRLAQTGMEEVPSPITTSSLFAASLETTHVLDEDIHDVLHAYDASRETLTDLGAQLATVTQERDRARAAYKENLDQLQELRQRYADLCFQYGRVWRVLVRARAAYAHWTVHPLLVLQVFWRIVFWRILPWMPTELDVLCCSFVSPPDGPQAERGPTAEKTPLTAEKTPPTAEKTTSK